MAFSSVVALFDELIPVVSQAYAEAGCPERFEVRQPKGNHAFLVEYFEWMTDWFRLASRS